MVTVKNLKAFDETHKST